MSFVDWQFLRGILDSPSSLAKESTVLIFQENVASELKIRDLNWGYLGLAETEVCIIQIFIMVESYWLRQNLCSLWNSLFRKL